MTRRRRRRRDPWLTVLLCWFHTTMWGLREPVHHAYKAAAHRSRAHLDGLAAHPGVPGTPTDVRDAT